MTKYIRYGLLATFTTLLISSGAAALEDRTVQWDEWNEFGDTIDNCESANCVEDDQMETISVEPLEARLDTGDTGYCGTAGLQKNIMVPDGEDTGLVLSLEKAELDNWGGRVGIKANDEWLISFTSEGGQSRTIDNTDLFYLDDKSTYVADISEYAGEEVTLKLATEDTSREWCNMGDHEQSITVNALFIMSDIENGDFRSSEDWQRTAVNKVNCENQYSCEGDQMELLDTNEISDSKLVLNTGMDSLDGHCGTYGRQQWVYVPKAENVELNFKASAVLDEWGGDIGVMFGEDWVFSFNDTRGDGKKMYRMQERTRDVSEYAGEYVKMKVAYQDKSGSYCDMPDHDRRMTVESVGFETSGDQVNEDPEVSLSSSKFAGTTVAFDASDTTDPDNGQGDLESKWDWNNDGNWDTEWLSVLQTSHTYGNDVVERTAKVKIRDGDGGSDTATETVQFGGNDGGSGGSPGELSVPASGWTIASFTSEVEKSKFSGCGDSAAAYYAGNQYGYLRAEPLTESGTLPSGKYFIHSTSNSDCTVNNVDLDTSADTGTLNIPSNGWRIMHIDQGMNKDEFNGCGNSPTAYYGRDTDGFLSAANLAESGTLPSGKYFVQSTSENSCSAELPAGSDSGNGGDTNYASTEDEWCQTNGNGQAISSYRDDVPAGCKSQSEMLGASGGSIYYPDSCGSEEGYICEQ